MTPSTTHAEARAFLRFNAPVFGVVALVMILAYGFALTSFALSVDEDTAFFVDWTDTWIRQGRPVVPLVKFLVGDTLPLPFFNLALSLAILFMAGVMWAFLVAQAAKPRHFRRPGLLVFLIVFTTLPTNAYYLAFNTFNIEVSLAWVWAAGCVWLAWLWAVEDRGWLALVASVVMGVLAALTYQDFSLVIVAGVLIVQLADLLGRRRRDRGTTRQAIKQTVLLFIPIVLALALAAVISLLIIERGGQVESTIAWGTAGIGQLFLRVYERIVAFVTGSGFVGGWVLLPTIAAFGLLIVLVARKGLRERAWYPLALLLLISVMPFALWILIGRPLPARAMQTLVLVVASTWLLLPLVARARRELTVALVVMAGLFAIWNGGLITSSFMTEHQTYEADRAIARDIGERLVQAGWDGSDDVPIVSVGPRVAGRLELAAIQDFVGFSLYNGIDGRRTSYLMRLMGYPMRLASAAEVATARERSTSMPAWPAAGSVVFEDGLAIVKFSEP